MGKREILKVRARWKMSGKIKGKMCGNRVFSQYISGTYHEYIKVHSHKNIVYVFGVKGDNSTPHTTKTKQNNGNDNGIGKYTQ